MKTTQRKQIQKHFTTNSIEKYLKLLKDNSLKNYHKDYIKEILKLSQTFNLRLSREQKLQFCKNCFISWNVNTREIRLNPTNKCKEVICKNCSFTRRFSYR